MRSWTEATEAGYSTSETWGENACWLTILTIITRMLMTTKDSDQPLGVLTLNSTIVPVCG